MASLKTLSVSGLAQVALAPVNPTDLVRKTELDAQTGLGTAPATPTSAGTLGQRAGDGNYVYVASGANFWIRTPAAQGWSSASVPAANTLYFLQGTASNGWKEIVVTTAANQLFGFDSSGNPVMVAQSLFALAAALGGYQPLDATLTALSTLGKVGTGAVVLKSYADGIGAGMRPAAVQTDLTPSAGVSAALFSATGFATLRRRIIAGAGSGSYTATYLLPVAGQTTGALVFVNVELPSSANPTVQISDGGSSTVLKSVTSPNPGVGAWWHGLFYFDGTAWHCIDSGWLG